MNSMIYNPLEEFDSKFKSLHLENTKKYLDNLIKRSAINIEENQKTVSDHNDFVQKLAKTKKSLRFWRFLRVIMIITIILIPLVFLKVNLKIKVLIKEIEQLDKTVKE